MSIIYNQSIAIHQPNYLPWLGYFYKIWVADVFVFLDHVQYSKQSYTQSVQIRKNTSSLEVFKLTVPIIKTKLDTAINEVVIHDNHWIVKHQKHILNTYKKFPFYEETRPLVNEIFEACYEFNNLAKLNIHIVSMICQYLGINTTLYQSSDLLVDGNSTELLLQIIQKTNSQSYFCGNGALNYQADQLLMANNIEIHKINFYSFLNDNPYICNPFVFINGLSIMDAMFVIGKEKIIEIFDNYPMEF